MTFLLRWFLEIWDMERSNIENSNIEQVSMKRQTSVARPSVYQKISVEGRRTAYMTSSRERGSSGGLIVLWALADLRGRVTLLSGYIQISGSHHWRT